jgi:hypothetical protein
MFSSSLQVQPDLAQDAATTTDATPLGKVAASVRFFECITLTEKSNELSPGA